MKLGVARPAGPAGARLASFPVDAFPRAMRLLIDLAIGIGLALLVGFASAWYAVERGPLFGSLRLGEWVAWPDAGSPDVDPYTGAMLAQTGEVPLGAGEGLAFSAETDSAGERLDGRCAYVVVGQTPAARLWTLTAYDGEGHLMENAARRTGFHSREILRRPDGRFEIAVSSRAEPGNWLPIQPVEHVRLVLRLYDTPLVTGLQIGGATMPRIVRGACL